MLHMKTLKLALTATIGLLCLISFDIHAQFPGCPTINAGNDQVLPCSQNCTNLTAVPFHTGLTNTYTVGSIPHAPPIPYNQAGGTAISVNTDDVWSPIINLPFNFCYYGTNYNTVKVGSNGTIKFGPATGGGGNPWSFTASCPSTALVNAGDIFGAYHDIDPSLGGTVKWYLLGSYPCRIFVVSFNQVPQFSCTNTQTTQMIVLYETTNAIDVYINNKPTCTGWNGGRAIVGIQNPAGTVGIAAPARNANVNWTVNTPEGWRFTPNGAPNYTVSWFQGATLVGTGNTINVCPGGTATYTASVTYNRCDGTQVTATDNVTVSYANLPPPTVTPIAESCANANDGSVTINNPVGAGPYTVAISGPTTGSVVEPNTAAGVASFNSLPDGAYTYTVTGSNGCTFAGSFNIGAGPTCCSLTASSTNPACNGGTTGTGTAIPIGQAPFSYSWSNGSTNQTATGLGAGSYTVTLTDNIGCVAVANITVTQPTAVSGSAVATNVTCNGQCNGTVTLSGSGGTGPYQFSNNGGPFQSGTTFSGLCAGNYTFTVRDANNCTFTIPVTITQPTPLTLSPGTLTPATCGGNNGTAVVNAGGGTAPYTYSVGGPSQGTNTFTGLAPGSYTATVTDAAGCTQTTTFTIVASNTPVASILSQQNISCFGGVNGSVLVNNSGGLAPVQYSLNGGPFQSSNTFGSLAAGPYTVTVQDANGCTSSVNFTITTPTQLTYSSSTTPTLCNGSCDGQITITPNGGTPPYQFSTNNGTTFSPANPITGLCANSYNIVVQDAAGCLASSLVNVTQPAPVGGTFVNTDPICEDACDGTSTVTASGGTPGYQYSANGGPLQSTPTLTGLCSGPNTILIQDINGCQFTSTQTLINPPGYNITTVVLVESNCGFNNGQVIVSADGLNGPFTFSMNGGPSNTTGDFQNLFGGAYSITVVDALGCAEQAFVGINDVEMDGITLSIDDATCFEGCDGQIEVMNVSGAPPITYEMDNSGITQTNGVFTGMCEGSHAVTIYDGGNCVFVIPFTTNEPTEIMFSTTQVDIACNGAATGQISFTGVTGGTGAYQYSIDGGFVFQPGNTFTGLSAGTYNLAVQDQNGCTVFGTATILELPPVSFVYSADDLTCFQNNTGFIQIVASGGSGGYEYSSDNGATFSSIPAFAGLAAGTYTVVVRDLALCTSTQTITINEPTALTSLYNTTDALCNGSCDGQVSFTASGGTTPYQYSVDNGVTFSTVPTIGNICAGTYTVIVKDANNCTTSASQTINEPTGVSVVITPTNSTCSLPNGELSFAVSGGTGPYNYSIDNGSTFVTTNVFTGLTATNYNTIVTDQNNCPVTSLETINNEASPIIIGAGTTDVSCNGACDGEVNTTVSGGTGVITYSIGGAPQTSPLITNICAGSYTLTITDDNNCTDTEAITITEPAVLTTALNSIDPLCFGGSDGTITCTTIGGTPPYMYSSNNGVQFSNNNVLGNLAAGSYTVVVEDANGCQTTEVIVLSEPNELIIDSQIITDASCYSFCDGEIAITTTGGSGGESYVWASGTVGTNSPIATGLCAGSYDVLVTDAQGCTVSEIYTVNEPPLLAISSISATDATCNGFCDGTISITSAFAVDFSIDNGVTYQSSPNFTGLCAGTYTVVVRNSVGCTESAIIVIDEPTIVTQVNIPEDGMTICYDGYGTLSANASGGTPPYLYVWDTDDTTQFLNVNLTQPTTFTCTVYDLNGCVSNVVSADVLIRPPFVASVTSPIFICPGEVAVATGSGVDGLPGYTYQWLNQNLDTLGDGDTYSYSPSANDTILLVAHDECYRYDTLAVAVNIHVLTSPTITADPFSGCSPLNVTFTNTMDPTVVASTTWTFSDGTVLNGTPSVNHTFIDVDCYNVNVSFTTVDGCVHDSTFIDYVCVVPDPIADFTFNPYNPTTINSTVNFTNQSINGSLYNWNFGSFGSSNQENPIVSYNSVNPGTEEVCLEVISPEGCFDEICKMIPFVEEFLIFVPNTFTPDNDAYNNDFIPVFPPDSKISDYTLLIFNRWGEIVFESHNYEVGWNGNYAEHRAQDGVYIWTIQLKAGVEKETYNFNGHVSLIR